MSAGNHGFSVSGDYWSGYVEEVQVIRCHRHCTYEETGACCLASSVGCFIVWLITRSLVHIVMLLRKLDYVVFSDLQLFIDNVAH